MSYECHITIEMPTNPEELDAVAREYGWKTSCIHGDPLLGKRGFFYFTTHHVDYDEIFARMEFLSGYLEAGFNAKPIRKKIEQIIYDTKTSLMPEVPNAVCDPDTCCRGSCAPAGA